MHAGCLSRCGNRSVRCAAKGKAERSGAKYSCKEGPAVIYPHEDRVHEYSIRHISVPDRCRKRILFRRPATHLAISQNNMRRPVLPAFYPACIPCRQISAAQSAGTPDSSVPSGRMEQDSSSPLEARPPNRTFGEAHLTYSYCSPSSRSSISAGCTSSKNSLS